MRLKLGVLAAAAGLLVASLVAGTALAQKSGGTMKVHHQDSPASMSIIEEATVLDRGADDGASFNNLVLYKQDEPQNSLNTIVPDLAISWSWSEDGAELTFKLRQGVKWHDGKSFTAADVKCTYDLLLGKAQDKLRLNPRKAWYRNLEEVSTKGEDEATFHLHRPQPAFIALLASGYSPIYPCHVSPRDMRTKPIGTGPFKFVEFKANESIKVARNPDYWKTDRPYLDGIEYTITPNRSTAIHGVYRREVRHDMALYRHGSAVEGHRKPGAPGGLPDAHAERQLQSAGESGKPPFNDADLRRAMALTLDRQSFIDILTEGQGKIGGAMLPPPEGIWGMPPEMLKTIPGYDPDVQKNRAEARKIMERLGYGPDKRLAIKVSTRNVASFRDPAVILIDQLKQIYIDGELETVETANWHAKVTRKDYTVAQNGTGSGPSTTRTSNSTRTTRAARTAITAPIATQNSTRSSTGNRWRPIRKSAKSWSGRSTVSCRKTAPGRSSFTTEVRPAGSLGSRA